ncbi:MAG: hypothetical protein HN353_11295 [Bdellovibrionales bacterium]|jgi:hypothetical protein|nr:hypothetical protein [Bdellovibrionales bacterium]MBT3525145.1 hypothetical protein [Bdellovibrionales bacterium]MBT7669755.1 hypothetical protein [Bdellovibrionales bacterium]MBT7766180.1 hypothetical protein [Bdellovibrionales bacterium]
MNFSRKWILVLSLLTSLSAWGFSPKAEFTGKLKAYYKMQDNYQTPLDAGVVRHGANNREDQRVRGLARFTTVIKEGKKSTNGQDWHQWIGVADVKIDANDPDHGYEADGGTNHDLDIDDFWVRFSPMLPVGFTLGVQTVRATAHAANIGHLFEGDLEDDFIFYTATALDGAPGLSTDIHFSKNLEIGLGYFNKMSDLSGIASGGAKKAANVTALWFKADFDIVAFTIAKQDVKVGGTKATGDDFIAGQYEHKEKHSVLNATLKFNYQGFEPYVGYSKIDGDTAAGVEMEVSLVSFGLIKDFKWGKFAFDYSKVDTPAYGETGSVGAAMELDTTMQFNYIHKMSKDADITFFANILNSKKDTGLRDAYAAAVAAGAPGAVAAATAAAATWTDTKSYGVAFNVRF